MEKHSKPAEDTYPQKIFAHQLITVHDHFQLRKELVQELLTALKSRSNSTPKKWMKAHEVRRLLKVSTGAVQTLKSSGKLPYIKMVSVHFFDYQDKENILQSGKTSPKIKY